MKQRTTPLPFRLIPLVLFTLLAWGCGRDPRQLSLADAPAAPSHAAEDPEELRRLQEMQLVRYQDVETEDWFSATAAELAELMRPVSGWLLGGACGYEAVCPGIDIGGPNCRMTTCIQRVELCLARQLQGVAMIRAQPFAVTSVPAGKTYSVPSQGPATKVALLREGYNVAKNALATLANFSACDQAGDAPEELIPGHTPTSSGPTMVSLYAETVLEAHRLTNELAFDTVDALAGIADAQRSQSFALKEGVARAISGAQLSRSEAAHLLIGGDPGLMGSTASAFCASPELSGRARTALNLIRLAAPSPTTVKGSTDMSTFLNASHAAFPEGSIAVRLAFLNGQCSGSVCAPPTIQKETGISTEDFTQARNYLAQELDAFARSATVTFTPSRVGEPAVLSGVQFYAATRAPPTPPPAEYYAALARYLKPGWTPPPSGQLHGDLAQNLNAAGTALKTALPTVVSLLKTSTTYPTLHTAIDGTVSALLSEDPRQGVFTRTKSAATTFSAHGYSTSDKLRVVAGLDGLLCATTGMVEGQPCASVSSAWSLNQSLAPPGYGYTSAVKTGGVIVSDSNTPLFLVRPKDPNEEKPGGYEYLTGFVVNNTTTGTTYTYPIVPSFDRKAGELLRPSTRWCTRSAVECDGTLFDERMPLENELSDDGDGVESSWRHYLALAEQAAAEAHALGEAYIANGIEVDRQAEAAELSEIDDYQRFLSQAEAELETVQDICGTAMSTEELLGMFGVNLESLAPNRTSCTSDGSCCNPETAPCAHTACVSGVCQATACTKDSQCCPSGGTCGYECITGRCARSVEAVLDAPNKTESVSRLQECIGERTVAPYAILGTDPVCIWTETGNKNKVCAGSSEEYPCPAVPRYDVNGDLTCVGIKKPSNVTVSDDPVSVFTTQDGEEIPLTLGLIQSGEGIVNDTCVDLRKLRHGLGSRDEICQKMLETEDYFIGHNDDEEAAFVDNVSAAFTFDAKGPRVDILRDDKVRWSTGGKGSAANRWPCVWHNFATQEECQETPNALFCQRVNCGATTDANEVKAIAQLNQRLIEAAVLLKGLSHMDFERIIVPATRSMSEWEESLGPLSPGLHTDRGTYLETSLHGANVWGPVTFTTFRDDPVSTGNTPFFYKHFTRDGVAPPGSEYLLSDDDDFVRALVNLDPQSWSYPALSELQRSTALCGDASSRSFQDGMKGRLWGVASPPEHVLPRGDGEFATDETLEAGLIPDLPYLTKRFRYTDEGLADVAELFCEVSRGKLGNFTAGAPCPEVLPENLEAAEHFAQVEALADCRVRDFERSLGRLVLPRIPVRVVQGIHDSANGAFPIVGGKVGEQMHRLRAALVRFGELNSAMRDAGRDLRDSVAAMRLSVEAVGVRTVQESIDVDIAELRGTQARIRLDQIDFQQQAAWAAAAFECASGWLSGLASAYGTYGASMLGTAIECERAHQSARTEAMNLNYERRITEVEQNIAQADQNRQGLDLEYIALEHARDLIQQRSAIRSQAGRMADLTNEGRAAIEEIFASLAELEGLRFKALRSINRALQYQTGQATVTKKIDQVLNSKLRVSKRRYQQAHSNAIRLAFLAKRAIEQRLGVHLSELRADLPLVDAPSSWESEICVADGIDYEALREEDRGGGAVRAFGQAYIGDYVGKLRNVVESYRLEHDFQEGTDEVVASVRDDVFHVRELCEKSVGNLLTYSSTLDHLTNDPSLPGWKVYGCPTGTNGIDASCFSIARNDNATIPLLSESAIFGDAPVYDLSWDWSGVPTLGQRKTLKAGRYRLSWFTGVFGNSGGYPVMDAGLVDDATGTAIAATPGGEPSADRWPIMLDQDSWSRQYRIFDLVKDGNYRVELKENAMPSGLTVAGLMLEALSASDALDDPSVLKPSAYVATQAETTRQLPVCEDTDGSTFRAQAWTRRCERICSDGFTGGCEHGEGPESCFWETTISLDQRDLDDGRILKQAGFARGNFNYRIESVALNFVGSDVRDCTGSDNPSTCYAGGFVTYSLKHLGPLFVRNHTGDDFPVKLFTGNIEHARGLGMERYLTNPLSGTDRELVTPYLRSEFQGRPLDGSFVLRVWEEPGVDFHAIQDVQLYLKYRYWTRFE